MNRNSRKKRDKRRRRRRKTVYDDVFRTMSIGRSESLDRFYGELRESVLLQGVASDTVNSQEKQLTMTNLRRFRYGSEE